jgi:hypothetical protein
MQVNDNKFSGIGSVLLGMTALALTCMIGTISLLNQVSEYGPKVGDIVSFDPTEPFSRDMRAQLTVTPTDFRRGATCILDVKTMHESGGSVIIEARQPQTPLGFRVHWAGGASSSRPTDCGQSADLLLSQQDIEMLAMAAGGYGVPARKPGRSAIVSSASAVQ